MGIEIVEDDMDGGGWISGGDLIHERHQYVRI